MSRRVFFAVALLMFSSIVCTHICAQEVKYISPNDDGVQDTLSFPLKVTDKRYVASWNLVVMDESGQVVRTIGNKEALPTHISFKNIIKHIKDAKKDADVPVQVVWNGRLDNGENAPDGVYKYYITATDDNGNASKTQEYTVVVDNTPPQAAVSASDKVFGAGDKAVLSIMQSGTEEDEWLAQIKDDSGKAVRHYSWKGKPKSFEWNGTDDAGLPVADGVYSYSIAATDRAGNKSARAGVNNIVYSADKAVTSIAIKGNRYFSPGTDSKQQTVSFDIVIPVPNKNSGNKIVSWEVAIVEVASPTARNDGKDAISLSDVASSSTNGNVVKRSWQGADGAAPMSSLEYDGTGDGGDVLPDGKYRARVTAKYLNGYEPPAAYSPVFVLDTSSPQAKIDVSDNIFGAGDKATITLTSTVQPKLLAAVNDWKGSIERNGEAVIEWDFGDRPVAVTWDGLGADDTPAPDGEYVYRLYGTDEAGNYGEALSEPFVLDTSEAAISLMAERKAFSPGGPTPVMNFATRTGEGSIARYTFSVMKSDEAVFTREGTGKVPARLEWDGMDDDGAACEDGEYTARLEVEGTNTSRAEDYSMPFVIDTVPPSLSAAVLVEAFAPGDGTDEDKSGVQMTAPVKVAECTDEKRWTCDVKGADGEVVKHLTWSGKVRDWDWDGTDESGNVASDGDYTFTFASVDEAMNSFSVTTPPVALDTRQAAGYITVENEGISPNGDGFKDTQKAGIALTVNDSIVSWQADVCDEKGKAVRSWKGGAAGKQGGGSAGSDSVPASLEWDGFAGNKAGEGTFNIVLRVAYKTGRTLLVSSRPFVCTATPPALSAAMAPQYFSPDNDGVDDDLFVTLGCETKANVKSWTFDVDDPRGKSFWQTGGVTEVAKKLIWDGLSNTQRDANGMAERVQSAVDYPYTFTVEDDLGMKSEVKGIIPVDVLVIREGNVLKMAVPSIIFRSDHADFKVETKPGKRDGVTKEQAANNEKVLRRVATVLDKFKDYKVTVVGHANRTNENEAEETEDNPMKWGPALIPLSKDRAEAVRAYLTKRGIKSARLDTEGMGGTKPVVDWHDKDNNWKNRRVEFILHK